VITRAKMGLSGATVNQANAARGKISVLVI
jgi:hypothetical protein